MLAQYIQPITEVVSTNIKTGLLTGSATGDPEVNTDGPSGGDEGDIDYDTEDLAKYYGWTASSDNGGWDEW